MKLMIEGNLPIFYFKEGRWVIAQCPVLDVVTQGRTLQEARKNIKEAIDLFFEGVLEMGTLSQALEELGWQRNEKKYTPPTLISHDSLSVQIPHAKNLTNSVAIV